MNPVGRVGLAVVASAAAVAAGQVTSTIHLNRKLQGAQYRWTSEHHDARNSGNSGSVGPGEATGLCKTDVRNMVECHAWTQV